MGSIGGSRCSLRGQQSADPYLLFFRALSLFHRMPQPCSQLTRCFSQSLFPAQGLFTETQMFLLPSGLRLWSWVRVRSVDRLPAVSLAGVQLPLQPLVLRVAGQHRVPEGSLDHLAAALPRDCLVVVVLTDYLGQELPNVLAPCLGQASEIRDVSSDSLSDFADSVSVQRGSY